MKGIQNLLEEFSDSCCLACCYTWLGLKHMYKMATPTNEQMCDGLQLGYYNNMFETDATVKDGSKLLKFLTGDDIAVSAKITKAVQIAEAISSGKYCLALYSYHNSTELGHWVVVKNKAIVFNSLEYSKNVATGVITAVRTVNI